LVCEYKWLSECSLEAIHNYKPTTSSIFSTTQLYSNLTTLSHSTFDVFTRHKTFLSILRSSLSLKTPPFTNQNNTGRLHGIVNSQPFPRSDRRNTPATIQLHNFFNMAYSMLDLLVAFAAWFLLLCPVVGDLCSNGATEIDGNWYCKAVQAIQYSKVGAPGTYSDITGMFPDGTCSAVPKSFSGPISPMDEEVSHFILNLLSP